MSPESSTSWIESVRCGEGDCSGPKSGTGSKSLKNPPNLLKNCIVKRKYLLAEPDRDHGELTPRPAHLRGLCSDVRPLHARSAPGSGGRGLLLKAVWGRFAPQGST